MSIRKVILSILLILVIGVAAFALSQSNEKEGKPDYELVFFDDFKTRKLNTEAWIIIPRNKYSWGKYMSDYKSLYQFRSGYLRLYARHNKSVLPADTAEYLTGGISTQGKRTIRYGKVEVRARLHGATGSWPAIWLFKSEINKKTPDPEYAEIDILEYPNRENYVMQTVHNYYTLELKKNNNPHTKNAEIDPEVFNDYCVEILPDVVIFSINGKETFRYPKIETDDIGQFPFGQELYLLIDMQVGAGWLPKPDRKTYPAYMDIDWVKIYKLYKNEY